MIRTLLQPQQLPSATEVSESGAPAAAFGAAYRPGLGETIGTARHAPSRTTLLFDGRLDNREEVAKQIGRDWSEERPSDPELVLALYLSRGEEALRSLGGPFALAIYEEGPRRLLLARDVLGSRTLHYALDDRGLLATTRVAGLLAVEGTRRILDEETVARYLALRGPRTGSTFFREIREVPPGHVLELGAEATSLRRFDRLEPRPLGSTRGEELEERFRELLARAVSRRLPRDRNVMVQMSGGLDSTSVAAMAVRALPAGRRLASVSYLFPELESPDESPWIEAMVRHLDLDALRYAGDSYWSFRGGVISPEGRGAPFANLYGALRVRLYELAAEAGTEVLLTGDFGDDLWRGGVGWLAGLLGERRYAEALAGALRSAWRDLRGQPSAHSLRAAVSYLVRPRSAARDARASRRFAPWLTPRAREVSGIATWTRPLEEELRDLPDAAVGHVGTHQLAQVDVADDEAERFGISVRRPYRERELVELAAALPADEVYRPGKGKWLLRRAMRPLLPTVVAERTALTSMTPLCDRGLAEREWPRVHELLRSPDAIWPRYVDSTYLWRVAAPAAFRETTESIDRLVVWHCVCVEHWLQGLRSNVADTAIPR